MGDRGLVPVAQEYLTRAIAASKGTGWRVIRCRPIHRASDDMKRGVSHELGAYETLLVVAQYDHGNDEVTTVEMQVDRAENLEEAVRLLPPRGILAGTRLELYREKVGAYAKHRRGML